MATATGTFEVQPGAEDPFEEDGGVKLTHANGTQRFDGDIVGDGAIEWLMCYLPAGGARFVGLQRITGAIDGRTGSVVIEAVGDHDGKGSTATWRIIEGTGTGELDGIRGEGGFDARGGKTVSYRLDYELG